MQKIIFLICTSLIITLFPEKTQCQVNLVYNGDFEIYDTCPPNFSQPGGYDYVRYCSGWYSAMYYTTPDYFNTCHAWGTVGVPLNGLGYQEANSGLGYCGFIAYNIEPAWGRNWWEYIQTKLNIPMEGGKNYKVSFYFSLAECSSWAVKKIGLYFSSDSVYRPGWDWHPFNLIPQIQSNDYITDSINWVLISGVYTANGDENFLTIGHFGDTIYPDTLRVKPRNPFTFNEQSYYYIDNISVELCENCTSDLVFIPNIFSPNEDGQNDFLYIRGNNISEIEFVVYNRWGGEVFRSKDISIGWDGTYNGKPCDQAVFAYYLSVSFVDGTQQFKKGNITLVR